MTCHLKIEVLKKELLKMSGQRDNYKDHWAALWKWKNTDLVFIIDKIMSH